MGNKISAVFVLVVFLASLVSVPVFAHDGEDDGHDDTNKRELDTPEKSRETETADKTRAEDERKKLLERARKLDADKLKKLEGLKAERLKRLEKLDVKQLDKIADLDKKQLERLSKLKEDFVKKLSEVDKEKLSKLAELEHERLRKFAALDKERLEKFAGLEKEILEKLSKLDRNRIKGLADLEKDELKAKLDTLKVELKRADGKERDVLKNRKDELKKRFDEVKEKFKQERAALKADLEELKKAKEVGDDSAVLEHAKKGLLRAAEVIITHLEKVKTKAQESEHLSEEEANDIVTKVDAKIAELKSVVAEIEAATTNAEIGAAETKNRLRTAAQKINAAWKRVKELAGDKIKDLEHGRVRSILHKALVFEKRLNSFLAKLEEKGVDISSVDAKVDEFSAKIEEVRSLLEKAKVSSGEERRNLLKQAHEVLKEAHILLGEIVGELKSLREATGDLPDVNELLEDESEEEIVLEEVG